MTNRIVAAIRGYSAGMIPSSTSLHGPSSRKSGDPLRVLIVDDDRQVVESLKETVEDLGDDALVGFDGKDAVTLAQAATPDVLLLDLSLPDMDGLTVAAQLRGMGGLAALKIIAVTGYGDAEARLRTAAAGFDLHLTKPVRFGILASMLDLLRSAPVPV